MNPNTIKTEAKRIAAIFPESVPEAPESRRIALLGGAEQDAEIEALYKKSTTSAFEIDGRLQIGQLFLIPVFFPLYGPATEVLQERFEAADLVSGLLSEGMADHSVHVARRLYTHAEVASWSALEMKHIARTIGEGVHHEPHPDLKVEDSIGVVSYIVGLAMRCRAEPILTLTNWPRLKKIVQTSLGLEASVGNTIVHCAILPPQTYQEAIISGSIGAIQGVILQFTLDKDGDVQADLRYPVLNGEPVASEINLQISNGASEFLFNLDMYRYGRNGVNEMLCAAYRALGQPPRMLVN
jgi:hypothetical protein